MKLEKIPDGDQGAHGVVYKVLDGQYKGAYAKTRITSEEIRATRDVCVFQLMQPFTFL